MRRSTRLLSLLTLLFVGISGCGDDDDPDAGILEPDPTDPTAELIATIRANLPSSLHATAAGMENWYIQPDGFGNMINVPYGELGCGNCHVDADSDDACLACHTDIQAAAEGTEEIDYEQSCTNACHGRQAAEIAMGLPDVHRDAGMDCGDCHTSNEIHGDGVPDAHMFDRDVFEITCISCHSEEGEADPPSTRQAHTLHLTDLSCEACHQANSVSCYNCHFAEEVENNRKVAYRKFADWVFLGNYRGKVYPMNFQSVEYEGNTFNAWGPFHGHTITREARDCAACHSNPALRDYDANGSLQIVEWDDDLNQLTYRRGIIPLVPDFETAYSFDYVTRGPDGGWVFLETGPDQTQIRFGTPLTADQLEKMRIGN
jgi:hypothetical protein